MTIQTATHLDCVEQIVCAAACARLGRLFAPSILRHAVVTTAAHLAGTNLGLKTIPVDRRRMMRNAKKWFGCLLWWVSLSITCRSSFHLKSVIPSR
ncbi:DUF1612 domain-containing protein [Rhizobium tropici]|uniref:DUF1612 domain-containing protein n=1 Tax=Rhizobium tropici TaxID=398 RepID=UPI003D7C27D5